MKKMRMFVINLKAKESLNDTQDAKFNKSKISPYQLSKIKLNIVDLHKWEKIWLLVILLRVIKTT